ncbi:hypothetical protein EW026_g5406 [Hermanssonia centrifuga]|uniref:Transmembrane protein n=1 Tax=Hermanssonia centrifuga TaxID=98765 RepID=A0A4S4KE75_9APHY|nr:hypothetical protein EW026_g5406 [Hermanssonia centrifuga]
MRNHSDSMCILIALLIWVAVNVADAWWIYFFVQACVDPNPHTAVNRTHSGFEGYEAMMFIFGFPWGIVNLVVVYWHYSQVTNSGRINSSTCTRMLLVLYSIFIFLPVALALVILPFFGGWIVVPVAQQYAWDHRCDSYPMYAILDAKSYYDARYVTNVAYFYLNPSQEQVFTYEIANPGDADIWTFSLRDWNTDQGAIPLDAYPTLQQVTYDFVDDSLSGNCTVPTSSAAANSTTLTSPCMTGTFDPGNVLSFNITSSVPLNNTLASNTTSAATPSSTSSVLRAQDKGWTFSDDAPSLILRLVNPLHDTLGLIVLRTAVTRPHDSTELKVCLAGVQGGNEVGAQVMAPLGLILMRQADYALYATRPSDDD